MTRELIDYHKTKMCLAGAEGRAEDYKFHKAAIELFEKLSLPSNLDEAAEKYSENILANNEDLQDAIEDAFIAGAEWMAGQGLTVDGTFHHSCGYPSVIELKTYLREYEGADVIVQIRKKQ